MRYEMLVLDLDGTLTNSQKKITPPTRQALIEIQQKGKKVVLASGRPTPGVVPLAKELDLKDYGSYILSFNGARITNCATGEIIYNKLLPASVIPTVYETAKEYDVDIDKFSLKAPAHFLTISEWENFNWDEKFKNTEFDVNVEFPAEYQSPPIA